MKLLETINRIISGEGSLSSFVLDFRSWSTMTFGSGKRTLGTTNHIRKELLEVEADPEDLTEWVDVILLGIEGYWRHGGRSWDLLNDLRAKLDICMSRAYPFPESEDEVSEHIHEAAPSRDPYAGKLGD